eukprot:5433528-Pyramimonas_sp.AAC.1
MAAIRQEGGAEASVELMAAQSKAAEVSRGIENHLTRRRRRQAMRDRGGKRGHEGETGKSQDGYLSRELAAL